LPRPLLFMPASNRRRHACQPTDRQGARSGSNGAFATHQVRRNVATRGARTYHDLFPFMPPELVDVLSCEGISEIPTVWWPACGSDFSPDSNAWRCNERRDRSYRTDDRYARSSSYLVPMQRRDHVGELLRPVAGGACFRIAALTPSAVVPFGNQIP
jgi:hypothetical protein